MRCECQCKGLPHSALRRSECTDGLAPKTVMLNSQVAPCSRQCLLPMVCESRACHADCGGKWVPGRPAGAPPMATGPTTTVTTSGAGGMMTSTVSSTAGAASRHLDRFDRRSRWYERRWRKLSVYDPGRTFWVELKPRHRPNDMADCWSCRALMAVDGC